MGSDYRTAPQVLALCILQCPALLFTTGAAGQMWSQGAFPPQPSPLTDSEHDGVSKLHVADADPGNEANQSWHHIGVVYIDGLSNGLEAIEQGLCVLSGWERHCQSHALTPDAQPCPSSRHQLSTPTVAEQADPLAALRTGRQKTYSSPQQIPESLHVCWQGAHAPHFSHVPLLSMLQ